MQGCEECGLRYGDLDPTAVPATMRSHPERYAAAIRGADADAVRVRPAVGRWSALEYACHVRDVLAVQHDRLQLALSEDRPAFAPMGREQRVVDDRYNQQDPEAVLAELARAADRLADAFAGLDEGGWRRTGIYNWPEQTERDMLWLARHTVHELIHHLQDIEDGFEHIQIPSLDGRWFASPSDVEGGEVVPETASGHCHSELALADDGRIRMHETWQWESRDGSGTSMIEELPHPEQ